MKDEEIEVQLDTDMPFEAYKIVITTCYTGKSLAADLRKEILDGLRTKNILRKFEAMQYTPLEMELMLNKYVYLKHEVQQILDQHVENNEDINGKDEYIGPEIGLDKLKKAFKEISKK